MGRGRLMQKLLAQQKKQDDNSGSNNNNYNDNNNNRSRPKKIRKIHDTLTSTSTGKYMNRGNAAAYKRPNSTDGVNMMNNKNVGKKRKRPFINANIKNTAYALHNNNNNNNNNNSSIANVRQTNINNTTTNNQQKIAASSSMSSSSSRGNSNNKLPEPYAAFYNMALAIDLGLMSVRSRHEYCSIDQVRSAVELSCQRSFRERDFAKVAFLFPGAYTWKYLRSNNNSNGKMENVLHIRIDKRCGGVETNELSANVGEKILRNRRKKLYEIIKRAAAQKVEVVPILLERMQDKAIAASSSSISSSSNSEHPNLGSRLNKAHRIGRLKISDVLSVSEESIVKHRKKATKEDIQRRQQALIKGILPTMCRALYTEFNMRDKNALIVDDKFLSKVACSIRGTISKERVKGLLKTLALKVPAWCTLNNIGRRMNQPRIVLRINRNPEEFLKCLNTLMKQ